LAVGGTTFTRNVQTIRQRHPQILIGTPGRLAELIVGDQVSGGGGGKKRGGGGPVHISQLQSVILDEFDALLSESSHADPAMAIMDFIHRKTASRTNRVMNARPSGDAASAIPPLQTILCSATASDMLLQPKKRLLLEQNLHLRPGYALAMAEEDTVWPKATASAASSTISTLGTRMSRTIIHGVVHLPHQRMALDMLRRILHTEPVPQQILVFVSDARRVNIVVDKLYEMNIIAAPLHGGMGSVKTDRAEVSKALRDGTVGLVVATEMAARGLDAPYLTHVINLDLPTDASHYAHRAGRCGRGRRPGVVINLTTSPQERSVPTKLANALGVSMYTVQVKNAKLNVVNPESLDWNDLL
jgi:superfamily II DNA/RNA helicase